MTEPSYYPIYASGCKDIPKWMRNSHEWQAAVSVDDLPRYQLKVKMCCHKCEDKLKEEVQEMHGVFDVHTWRLKSKVVVVASATSGLNKDELLRRVRKIDPKAKFVLLDDEEKPIKKRGVKHRHHPQKSSSSEESEESEEESIHHIKPYIPSPYHPSQTHSPHHH